MRRITPKILISAIIFVIAFLALFPGQNLQAQILDDLKNQIEARSEEIKKLETEAVAFRKEVETRQEQGKTLKGEITRLDRTVAKLRTDIALTEKKIQKTELEIEKLALEIHMREFEIKKLRGGLASLIQDFFERNQEPLVFAFLRYPFLSDFFRDIDHMTMVEGRMVSSLDALHKLREELGEKKVQQALRIEKNELLTVTKNQEKAYVKLLADSERKREILEGEIRELEEKIRVTIDPASLPAKGSG